MHSGQKPIEIKQEVTHTETQTKTRKPDTGTLE